MTDAQRIIAILTAYHYLGERAAAKLVSELDREGLVGLLGFACGMLLSKTEHECEEAGITVDEYLRAAGAIAATEEI